MLVIFTNKDRHFSENETILFFNMFNLVFVQYAYYIQYGVIRYYNF